MSLWWLPPGSTFKYDNTKSLEFNRGYVDALNFRHVDRIKYYNALPKSEYKDGFMCVLSQKYFNKIF